MTVFKTIDMQGLATVAGGGFTIPLGWLGSITIASKAETAAARSSAAAWRAQGLAQGVIR